MWKRINEIGSVSTSQPQLFISLDLLFDPIIYQYFHLEPEVNEGFFFLENYWVY